MADEISILGWKLRTFEGEDEPRIHEAELAERLGCDKKSVRRTFRRLQTGGILNDSNVRTELCAGKTGVAVRKDVADWFYDEEGAIQVAADTVTDRGRALRKELARVYIAYRRGQLVPATPAPSPGALVPVDVVTQLVNVITSGFERQTEVLRSMLQPPTSRYIDEQQVRHLKRLARKGCRALSRPSMKPIWENLCKRYHFPSGGRVFSTVFTEQYQEVELDLRALVSDPPRAKVLELPSTVPMLAPHRPATEHDLGVQAVAERLTKDLNYKVNWGHLSRPNGLYEASHIDVLHLPRKGQVASSSLDREGPAYLDESRYQWFLHWMRTNDSTVKAIVRMQEKLSLKELLNRG